MHRANLAGFDDALWLSAEGHVLETCIANIFLVQGHTLYTPPADGSILPGVMREKVLETAHAQGFHINEAGFRLANIEKMDEAFCTNAVRGIIPVGRIGAFLLPRTPGPVAQALILNLS
jgi:branched-subunit amino acid aminotransferase/4-amino-4-deoxychorismate lyase